MLKAAIAAAKEERKKLKKEKGENSRRKIKEK